MAVIHALAVFEREILSNGVARREAGHGYKCLQRYGRRPEIELALDAFRLPRGVSIDAVRATCGAPRRRASRHARLGHSCCEDQSQGVCARLEGSGRTASPPRQSVSFEASGAFQAGVEDALLGPDQLRAATCCCFEQSESAGACGGVCEESAIMLRMGRHARLSGTRSSFRR